MMCGHGTGEGGDLNDIGERVSQIREGDKTG